MKRIQLQFKSTYKRSTYNIITRNHWTFSRL